MKFSSISRISVFTFCLFIASMVSVHAQNQELDVVHLKEGGVLKGTVLPESNADEIQLQLAGGAVLNIPMSRVAEISVEERMVKTIKEPRDRSWEPKEKGYVNFNHTTFSFSQSRWGDTQVGFTVSSSHGYRFNRHFAIAGGVGVDTYPSYSEVFYPFYGRIGGEVLKKKITPFWFIEAGYSLVRDSWDEWEVLEGGVRTHSGAGVRFYLTQKIHLDLNLGFRYQKSTMSNTWDTENQFLTVREYQRTTFGVGMGF